MMKRSLWILTLISLMSALLVAGVLAQTAVPATTVDQLNVRVGPGAEYDRIDSIPLGATVLVEARNWIGNWALVRTQDNSLRGWVATRYLTWADDQFLASFPVSEEVIGGPPAPPPVPDNADLPQDVTPPPPPPADNPPPVADVPAIPVPQDAVIGTVQAGTLNVRTGPGGEFDVISTYILEEQVLVVGRNQIGNWVLTRSLDGQTAGWVASRYMTWDEDTPIASIPITGQVIGVTIAPETGVVDDTSAPQPIEPPADPILVPEDALLGTILVSNLNIRTGPGTEYARLASLDLEEQVLVEARNDVGNWTLVQPIDGTPRGWIATRYITWEDEDPLAALTVSTEIIGVTAPEEIPNPDDADAVPLPDATPLPALPPVVDGTPAEVIVNGLNVRTADNLDATVIDSLNQDQQVVVEARNWIGNWVLVRTLDGSTRGWVATRYLVWDDEVLLSTIPLFEELNQSPDPAAPLPEVTPEVTPDPDAQTSGAQAPLDLSGDIAALEAQLAAVPVVPQATNRAYSIFSRTPKDRNRFTKVGDCNSENISFMYAFDWDNYSLGDYGYLEDTISYFKGSFAQESVAGKVGYSAVTAIDALWADPELCEDGEAPVYCELRVSEAAFVVIMFGANDISVLTPERYDSALRRILDISIRSGAVPVLSTFPTDPTMQDRWLKALQLNVITVNVAREYDVPVMNFWLAARDLPSAGMGPDNAHLTGMNSSRIAFDGSENTYGFTMRNLVVLQTLDQLRRQLAG